MRRQQFKIVLNSLDSENYWELRGLTLEYYNILILLETMKLLDSSTVTSKSFHRFNSFHSVNSGRQRWHGKKRGYCVTMKLFHSVS